MSPRKLGSEKARTPQLSDGWGPIKWFLLSMLIGGVAGSAVAFEYYGSISPREETPLSVAPDQPIDPTVPAFPGRTPSTSSETIPTPLPTLLPSSTPIPTSPTSTPPPTVEPTPTLTLALNLAQIFAMNDRGEISDAEAKRLLSRVIFEGESEGRLIDEAKEILERVWTEEGQGRNLFITLTHIPIDSSDIDSFSQFEFEAPNKVTIVIPDDPTELSNGLVYAISFVSLAMASADDAFNIPESQYRSIYNYATDYEVSEIWGDCGQLETIYCSLFMEHSRSPS